MDVIILGLAELIDSVLFIYMMIVIVAVLLTWVNPDPYNPIVRTLRALTEPVFYRVRRMLPFLDMGGIDLSPVAVILFIGFLRFVVPTLLVRLANSI